MQSAHTHGRCGASAPKAAEAEVKTADKAAQVKAPVEAEAPAKKAAAPKAEAKSSTDDALLN